MGLLAAVKGVSVLTWIKFGVFAVAAIAVGLFWWHYTALKSERDQLMLDKASLERTTETQRKRIEEDAKVVKRWEAADLKRKAEIARLEQSRAEARDYARRVDKFFGSVDLRQAARDDRVALQLRINSGTADALRLWECASGGGVACPVAGAADAARTPAP